VDRLFHRLVTERRSFLMELFVVSMGVASWGLLVRFRTTFEFYDYAFVNTLLSLFAMVLVRLYSRNG